MNPFDLSGKVALVSGANSGIGQALSVALAQAGADIALLARREPSETQAKIAALGRRNTWIAADFGSTPPGPAIIEQTITQLGGLDILVNNAGTIRRNEALNYTEAEWDDVVDVNLKSVFFLSQLAARYWIYHQRSGKVINIASMLSFQGGIRVVSYTASKSGLLGITRALANEWAAQGINVNAIAPGYIETDNTAALRADPQRQRDILARIPAARWGVASDLAGAAVFLASNAANYVHGAVLPVDGGWLGR